MVMSGLDVEDWSGSACRCWVRLGRVGCGLDVEARLGDVR